jgi:hypothetical protein
MAWECVLRLARDLARDPTESNAYLESSLVHVRSLYDFLCGSSTYADDILRIDFAPAWSPTPGSPEDDARVRLAAEMPAVNKYLAHLSWTRLDTSEQAPNVMRWWKPVEAFRDIALLLQAWAVHLGATTPTHLPTALSLQKATADALT